MGQGSDRCEHEGVTTDFRPSSTGRRLTRRDDGMVAGVASGIADYLAVDPLVVRLAFGVLTVTTGIGVVVYLLAWWFMPAPGAPSRHLPAPRSWRRALRRDDTRTMLGAAFLALGGVLLLRDLGLLFNHAVVWPLTLAATGLAVVWARTGDGGRERLLGVADRNRRDLVVRVGAGVVLVVAGGIALLVAGGALSDIGSVLLAVVVTLGGLTLLLGPWAYRLLDSLATERRERIRSEERAEVAAHLHDSVLQTLALIQRSAPSRPAEVVALARRQERELRAWLYGDRERRPSRSLAAAIDAVAVEVETNHGVEVEAVTVGDCSVDGGVAALVAAVREATVNAAKHAGVVVIDVFVEVDGDRVAAYVRDRGTGFDVDAVPADRRGITESIQQRMARHGGTAIVTSAPGEGTEVALTVKGPS
jgi:signal transduction histidine kinase/phage shock protein PspC (stress-responsive transcriptional regulator)